MVTWLMGLVVVMAAITVGRARARRRVGVEWAGLPPLNPEPAAETRRAPGARAEGDGGGGPVVHRVPEELTLLELQSLAWQRLEELAASYFATQGWRAEMTSAGADGGVDVRLVRVGDPGRRGYVQCKAWNQRVDVKMVRELFGVMAADGVAEGWFVNTDDFTPDARAFAQGKPLHLLSGPQFVRVFAQVPVTDRRRILAQVFRGDYTRPTCPTCGRPMVLRPAKDRFWGCPKWPACRSRGIRVRKRSPRPTG